MGTAPLKAALQFFFIGCTLLISSATARTDDDPIAQEPQTTMPIGEISCTFLQSALGISDNYDLCCLPGSRYAVHSGAACNFAPGRTIEFGIFAGFAIAVQFVFGAGCQWIPGAHSSEQERGRG
jgi:hypothetical protein